MEILIAQTYWVYREHQMKFDAPWQANREAPLNPLSMYSWASIHVVADPSAAVKRQNTSRDLGRCWHNHTSKRKVALTAYNRFWPINEDSVGIRQEDLSAGTAECSAGGEAHRWNRKRGLEHVIHARALAISFVEIFLVGELGIWAIIT